jgi:threonine dehydrogenase-like Zn-dependent dehydrogenase
MSIGMRAVAQSGTRDVQVVLEPEPSLASPQDVKLRILKVGVCGSRRSPMHH